MKCIYRVYVKRYGSIDWELVASSEYADEAHAIALHWEQTTTVYEIRLDVCLRYLNKQEASGKGPSDE